ncbi:MAG: translocation/assembly module TamB domain-containing protein, partial [Pseudomonadota bacterium]|nr:translocation/assembly module TamB domain-containing protein [Pseudomonadota bacterium]
AEQTVALALREPFGGHPLSLTARAALSDLALTVQQAELRAGDGRLSAQGRIDWTATRAFALTGRAQQLRLQDFGQFANLPALQLNGSFALNGARAPRLIGEMTFHLDQSSLAGRPLQGDGALHLDGETLALPHLTLRAGDNVLQASGTLLSAQTALRFSLQAPRLEQLGASLAGAASISGTLTGQLRRPQLAAQWNASALRLPGAVTLAATHGNAVLQIDPSRAFALGSAAIDASLSGLVTPNAQCAQIDVHLDAAAASQAPLSAHVVATQLAGAGLAARTLRFDVAGTTGRHRITASLDDPAQRWQFGASGGVASLGPTMQWRGDIERFDGAGKVSMALRAPASLSVTQARVALEHFLLDLNGAQLNITEFLRDPSGIVTRGRIDHLALAPWLAMVKPAPAVRTDLLLAADWNLRVADSVSGSVQVHRESGDVVVMGSVPVALGMSDLTLSLQARDGALSTRLSARGQQFGRVDMDARSQLGHGAARLSLAPDAALAGSATLDVPSLGWLGPALFPGLVSAGHLHGDVAISGTVAQPRYAGHLSGQALRVFFAEQGVDLRNGVLDSEFQGERLVLRTLHFEQAGGTLDASGPINLVAGQPDAQISVVARRFALLNRSDRRVIVSGDGEVGWRAQHLNLAGKIRVDGGNIDLGRADAPHLSDDVVLVGADRKTSAPSALVVDLALDLGDGIALTGR